jgi:hypothetical protein
MPGFVGVIEIDASVGGVTASVEEPDILPHDAVTVARPVAAEAAKPLEPSALLMAATSEGEQLQVAVAVRSCVVLSEKVPMAVNCRRVPSAMLGSVGVTVRDTSIGGVTVSVIEADILPDVAVIVVRPIAAGVARPLEPAALLMAATAEEEELQLTDAVRSCVVLSENVPTASNCRVVPSAMLGSAGLIEMDMRVEFD